MTNSAQQNQNAISLEQTQFDQLKKTTKKNYWRIYTQGGDENID